MFVQNLGGSRIFEPYFDLPRIYPQMKIFLRHALLQIPNAGLCCGLCQHRIQRSRGCVHDRSETRTAPSGILIPMAFVFLQQNRAQEEFEALDLSFADTWVGTKQVGEVVYSSLYLF